MRLPGRGPLGVRAPEPAGARMIAARFKFSGQQSNPDKLPASATVSVNLTERWSVSTLAQLPGGRNFSTGQEGAVLP